MCLILLVTWCQGWSFKAKRKRVIRNQWCDGESLIESYELKTNQSSLAQNLVGSWMAYGQTVEIKRDASYWNFRYEVRLLVQDKTKWWKSASEQKERRRGRKVRYFRYIKIFFLCLPACSFSVVILFPKAVGSSFN